MREPSQGTDASTPQVTDSITVIIDNRTQEQLDPAGENDLDHGSFEGGDPIQIAPLSTGRAFKVVNSFLAGPQGSVAYKIDKQAKLVVLFNVNVSGRPGAYFYAGLQPLAPGADPTGFYVDVTGFPMFTNQTVSSPTITLRTTLPRVDPTPLPPVRRDFAYMINVWVANNTPGPLTLADVVAPRDVEWQPAVAETVAPQTTALIMTMFLLNFDRVGPDPQLVYNVPGAGQVTFTVPAGGHTPTGPVSLGFSGNADVAAYAAPPAVDNDHQPVFHITYTLDVTFGLPLVVELVNLTHASLVPTRVHFSEGALVPGTEAATIPAGGERTALRALGTVHPPGAVVAAIEYALAGQVTMTLQTRVNPGGAPGWYFYPLLAGAGADPTDFAVRVERYTASDASAKRAMLAPRVTLAPAGGAVDPLEGATAPKDVTAAIIDVYVRNDSGAAMTLAQVRSPLGVPWQPGLAPAIAKGAASSLLMTAALLDGAPLETIIVVYNVAGGTELTLTLPANHGGSAPLAPPSGAFSGPNPRQLGVQVTARTPSTLGRHTTYGFDLIVAPRR